MRAHGLLVEVRAAELRFTPDECVAFLNGVMGLDLDAAVVAMLGERTEGWIAGLQMAAVRLAASSAAERENPAHFVRRFAGTHRYIMDYLLEEVLEHQPAAVQEFLLRTALLPRLCAPLCAALLAVEPAVEANNVEMAASLLARIERDNLFLLPLDDERRWYRYHALFADLLRARLHETYPGLADSLHAAAARWFEVEGSVVEAVDHALAAGDHERAARLVERNTEALLARGEMHVLLGWSQILPESVRARRPWLCLHQATALAFGGRLAEAETLLAQAERAYGGATPSEQEAFLGAAMALRAMLVVMAGGDEAKAVRLATQAQALLPPHRLWDRATAAWALGYAQRSRGDLVAAGAAFEEQIALARAMGNVLTLVTGLMDLAMVARTRGRLVQARALFEQALTEAAQADARGYGYIARMEAGLASVLYDQNEVEAARQLLDAAAEHLGAWPNPNHQAYLHLVRARLQRTQGDLPAAVASARAAADTARRAPLTRVLARQIDVEQVRLALAGADAVASPGQVDTCIEQWRAELTSDGTLDEVAELAALAVARILLARKEHSEALRLLARAADSARAAGRAPLAAEALIVTALAQAPKAGGCAGNHWPGVGAGCARRLAASVSG